MYLLYHRLLGLDAVKWYRCGDGMDPRARVLHLRQVREKPNKSNIILGQGWMEWGTGIEER